MKSLKVSIAEILAENLGEQGGILSHIEISSPGRKATHY